MIDGEPTRASSQRETKFILGKILSYIWLRLVSSRVSDPIWAWPINCLTGFGSLFFSRPDPYPGPRLLFYSIYFMIILPSSFIGFSEDLLGFFFTNNDYRSFFYTFVPWIRTRDPGFGCRNRIRSSGLNFSLPVWFSSYIQNMNFTRSNSRILNQFQCSASRPVWLWRWGEGVHEW